MLNSILIGIGLIGFSVVVHSFGTTLLLRMLQRRGKPMSERLGSAARPAIMVTSSLSLLLMHFVEVVVWALAYWRLTDLEAVRNFEDAVYFSAVTFSTLGYGDITLTGNWRLLCGMQAISGILLCGWSTALLFVLVQYLWIRSEPNAQASDSESHRR